MNAALENSASHHTHSPTHSVLVSILNWNSAAITLECVASVLALSMPADVVVQVIVVDNGSTAQDYQLLRTGLENTGVALERNEVNLGFAGGHNLAIARSLREDIDFIWLLNSDARSNKETLAHLLTEMKASPSCGAASPMIVRMDQPEVIDFAGAVHEWPMLDSIRPLDLHQAEALSRERPNDIWIVGTAILFRCAALRQVGMLDERYFAYYEDDDICARLSAAGWRCVVVFDALVEHACFDGVIYDRPPYYFYLMARNAFRFWGAHTPTPNRRLLKLRLLETWTFMASRLHARGLAAKRDACLLGIADGLMKRHGPPILNRPVPVAMRLFRRLREASHRRHLQKTAS